MKKISVVIPCYNAVEYLDRCMESILKQTIGLENIEIILVDDASTDNGATLSLMMEYEKRYSDNIIVIPLEQNLRQGGARNVGVLYAGGEYLMFCDADDWLKLDAMEILYRIAVKHAADVVEFQFEEVTEINPDMPDKYMEGTDIATGIEEKIKCEIREFDEDDEDKKTFLMYCTDDCGLGALNKLYRLPIIQDNHIRFVEHLICEEPSFTLPARVYERKHVLIYAKLYCYFQSPGSTTRSSWDDKKFDNIQVWLHIVKDFEERGLIERYYKELEYMFYGWGFRMSIRMLIAKGYTISEEELNFFKKIAFQLFPNIRNNSYVVEGTDGWNMLILALLEMELTKENVPELNRLMRYYLEKYAELLEKHGSE
ncbi:MAG: glycosyltransferase family 2 protein [Bacillus sp. (in: Bacteria)]|nr:glycosyltransferase family 2 protein [Bacillus sp. (in: firmicutes)]MCM1426685.1 glycosyltransferase family 2 protein [Eubacterium sp.]